MTFGERLRHKRERREWTQGQLSIKMKVSNKSIHRWEHDICLPTFKNLFRLAEIFGCTVSELLGR